MLIASIPPKVNIPFGNSAGAGFIRQVPDASQIGIQAGAASFTDGFPPVTFLPIGAGGTPPWGADFNGILNQVSAWSRWQAAGGPVAYDSTFSAAIGGYPSGALIRSANVFGTAWLSSTDNNISNPDAGGANWSQVQFLGGTATTGTWQWRPTAEILPGWVKANATTIGNSASNATQLADTVNAAALFAWLWVNFSNTLAPIFTSAGVPTTRGANAAADFAANKAITVYDMRGKGIIGMDTMGGAPTTILASVPAFLGSATQPGSIIGEVLHTLLLAELAAHNHAIVDPGHNHGVNDPTHNHAHSDPTHTHGVGDGGHNHPYGFVVGTSAVGQYGTSATGAPAGTTSSTTTGGATTGIGIVAAATGMSNVAGSTGISNVGNVTGVSTSNAGSTSSHNNTPFSVVGSHYLKL
jgi:hypothetical protein